MVMVFFTLSLQKHPPCRGGKTGNGKTGLKIPTKVQEDQKKDGGDRSNCRVTEWVTEGNAW